MAQMAEMVAAPAQMGLDFVQALCAELTRVQAQLAKVQTQQEFMSSTLEEQLGVLQSRVDLLESQQCGSVPDFSASNVVGAPVIVNSTSGIVNVNGTSGRHCDLSAFASATRAIPEASVPEQVVEEESRTNAVNRTAATDLTSRSDADPLAAADPWAAAVHHVPPPAVSKTATVEAPAPRDVGLAMPQAPALGAGMMKAPPPHLVPGVPGRQVPKSPPSSVFGGAQQGSPKSASDAGSATALKKMPPPTVIPPQVASVVPSPQGTAVGKADPPAVGTVGKPAVQKAMPVMSKAKVPPPHVPPHGVTGAAQATASDPSSGPTSAAGETFSPVPTPAKVPPPHVPLPNTAGEAAIAQVNANERLASTCADDEAVPPVMKPAAPAKVKMPPPAFRK